MNTVPIDFCERVLAMRKCCEGVNGKCFCLNARWSSKFYARKWNQPKQILISFHVGPVNGKWKYGFSNVNGSDEWPTMDELRNIPQLKNLQISSIELLEKHYFDGMLKHDVVDLEKLLNFVSFLSNEPSLYLYEFTHNDCDSPEWKTVLKWLAERWFSYVSIGTLKPSHYPILEKQFSRWTPSEISVEDCGKCADVVERRLMSGDLRRFRSTDLISSAVFERIIWNFRENPRSFAKDELHIKAYFWSLELAEKVMETEVQKKFCSFEELQRCEHVDVHCRYRFDREAAVLLVDKLSNGSWKLRTCEKVGWRDLNSSCVWPECPVGRANQAALFRSLPLTGVQTFSGFVRF